MAKLSRPALILALIPAVSVGALQAQPTRRASQWRNVIVSYNPADEAFAEVALQAAKDALPRLQGVLGIRPDASAQEQPIRIDIARRQRDFNQFAGVATKPWVQGLALTGQRRIVLKTLLPAVLRKVTAHELTHVLFDALAAELGAHPPRWLHEGVAKFAADDFNETDRQILGQAALDRRLLTLDQLDQGFAGKRDQVALAYAQSYTLVRFLHELQPGSLRELLANSALTGDLHRALLRTYGQPAEALQKQWLQSTQTTYLRRGIPLQMDLVIFAIMAGLAVAAFVVQRRRRRIIRQRLQEEEFWRGMFHYSELDDDRPPPAEDDEPSL